MKRALFQLFNLLMACVVLLSSTGFGLVEHACQMRGKQKTVVVAFSDAKTGPGCLSAPQPVPSDQTALRKTECCQDDQRYDNVTVSASLSQLVAKFVKSVTETVLTSVVAVLAWLLDWVYDTSLSVRSAVPAPALPSGRAILLLVHRLLL